MKTVDLFRESTDPYGDCILAWNGYEWCGVSEAGEDESIRSIDEIKVGDLVEVGTETMRVIDIVLDNLY
jgi:hypothetical protein